jgi:hypothetical protein
VAVLAAKVGLLLWTLSERGGLLAASQIPFARWALVMEAVVGATALVLLGVLLLPAVKARFAKPGPSAPTAGAT